MFHKLPGLYEGATVVTFFVLHVVLYAVSEYIQRHYVMCWDVHDYSPGTESGYKPHVHHPDHYPTVAYYVWPTQLPNHWLWYDAEALMGFVEACIGRSYAHTLVYFVYCAAFTTAACAFFHMSALMFVVMKCVRRSSWWAWVWLLPATSFFIDLAEDLCIVFLAQGYPHTKGHLLADVTASLTLWKYSLWVATYVVIAAAALAHYAFGVRVRGKTKVL